MIRLIWAVFCRSSAVDRDSNALSLFDVIEEFTLLEPITEKGAAPFGMQLVTLWMRANPAEPAKGVARVTLFLPSGKGVKPDEFQIDLTEFARLRHRLTIAMFPIVEVGVHEVVVEIQQDAEWKELARVPIELKVAEPAK